MRLFSHHAGAILSLLGSALVIYGVFFLPMALGNGGGSFTPTSEWTVATVMYQYICGPTTLLLAFPLLLMLLVLGMSVASLFHEISSGMAAWRRRAALAALVTQAVLGLYMVILYTFGFDFGAGFWVALLGFVVMLLGTWFNSPRPAWIERRIARVQSRQRRSWMITNINASPIFDCL